MTKPAKPGPKRSAAARRAWSNRIVDERRVWVEGIRIGSKKRRKRKPATRTLKAPRRATWLDREHFDESDMPREEALNTASADPETATRLLGWHPVFCRGFRLGWAAAMASVTRPPSGAAKRRKRRSVLA